MSSHGFYLFRFLILTMSVDLETRVWDLQWAEEAKTGMGMWMVPLRGGHWIRTWWFTYSAYVPAWRGFKCPVVLTLESRGCTLHELVESQGNWCTSNQLFQTIFMAKRKLFKNQQVNRGLHTFHQYLHKQRSLKVHYLWPSNPGSSVK